MQASSILCLSTPVLIPQPPAYPKFCLISSFLILPTKVNLCHFNFKAVCIQICINNVVGKSSLKWLCHALTPSYEWSRYIYLASMHMGGSLFMLLHSFCSVPLWSTRATKWCTDGMPRCMLSWEWTARR